MPIRHILHNVAVQKAKLSGVLKGNPCAEETPAPRQPINIDEFSASPWVGLHYRHEFLLHYRHELLVQHLKGLTPLDTCQ